VTGRRLLGSPAARALGTLVGIGLLTLLVLRLGELWDEHPLSLEEASVSLLLAGFLASVLAVTAFGAVWPTVLRALGVDPPRGLLTAFYAGQLGKYLPGAAWQYAGRAALAVRLGVPLRTAGVSLALEAGCSLGAALLVAPLVLAVDAWELVAVVAAVTAFALLAAAASGLPATLALLRRTVARLAGDESGSHLHRLPGVVGRYALVWLAFGLAFWLTARALYDVPLADLPLYTGTFALAWAAGFAAVFVPAGLGVREAVIVAVLREQLGESEAIVVAAASRIAYTLVDLAGGATALALLGLRPLPQHGPRAGARSRRL
jgi:uncharacterized membrane protein YbhN (UPF0104 family)